MCTFLHNMLLSSLLLPRASPAAAAAAAARSLQRRVRFIQTLVEFKNANVHRFGQNEPAMRDLTFSIDRNQRLVIVGPVSAGKTTLAEASPEFIILLGEKKGAVVITTTMATTYIGTGRQASHPASVSCSLARGG